MSTLAVERLTKSFGKHVVLRSVDFSVEEHEVVALIGASGSGKSTLLRCINLLESIDEGRIFLADREITRARDVNAVRRRIGIVFQAFNLFPHMNVLRNVTLAPRDVLGLSKAEADERAVELLERFGLADKRLEYPDRLSGGQQQRVAIVRALAMRPELMLLDEVTSALDPELVAEVLQVIGELAQGGMTMVLATHEMSFARDIANRVCFLDEGRILEEGPPDEIFTQPREARTQQFLERIIKARAASKLSRSNGVRACGARPGVGTRDDPPGCLRSRPPSLATERTRDRAGERAARPSSTTARPDHRRATSPGDAQRASGRRDRSNRAHGRHVQRTCSTGPWRIAATASDRSACATASASVSTVAPSPSTTIRSSSPRRASSRVSASRSAGSQRPDSIRATAPSSSSSSVSCSAASSIIPRNRPVRSS